MRNFNYFFLILHLIFYNSPLFELNRKNNDHIFTILCKDKVNKNKTFWPNLEQFVPFIFFRNI